MGEKPNNKTLSLTCLFGAFVFLQYTVLSLANHAGEGWLGTARREEVYYALQVFVILGYLLYGLLFRTCAGRRGGRAVTYGVLGLFPICVILLLAADHASRLYVVVSMAAALCVGLLGGPAHLRMSMETAAGADTARSMGLGSAAAVVLQYLFQLRAGVTPLLPVFLLAAFVLYLYYLRGEAPETVAERDGEQAHTPRRRIVFAVVIAATFILFACFYNEYIHHLMIRSDYGAYNVYSWPRLTFVPVYLLFAALGDRRDGKLVPLVSLCIMLISLLTVVLVGSPEGYWLSMCLFYCTIGAYTCYYLLTFWRLAPGTRRPTFWAPFGRMLDSAMVLFTGVIHLSALPSPVVIGVDIAGVALVILLMAIGGDFNLSAPEPPPTRSPEEALERMRSRYGLTDREAEVLQKLLLTEDGVQAIADSLFISRRVLERYISSIYQKTGTKSRIGLFQLYHEASREA